MNFKVFLFFAALSMFSLRGIAHEGHDSATIKSLYGGIVKKSASAFFEIIQEEGKIEIYVSDHNYKNIVTQTLAVSAFADIKGKKIPLKLNLVSNKLLVVTDLKREKFFKLNVILKLAGKEESVIFPLEN